MCVCIYNLMSSIIYLHGFQVSGACVAFIVHRNLEITTNKINHVCLKQSSDRLVVVSKVFLKLLNMHMLIKQKDSSLPRKKAL